MESSLVSVSPIRGREWNQSRRCKQSEFPQDKWSFVRQPAPQKKSHSKCDAARGASFEFFCAGPGSLSPAEFRQPDFHSNRKDRLPLNLHHTCKTLELLDCFRRVLSRNPSRFKIFGAAAPRWEPWM